MIQSSEMHVVGDTTKAMACLSQGRILSARIQSAHHLYQEKQNHDLFRRLGNFGINFKNHLSV